MKLSRMLPGCTEEKKIFKCCKNPVCVQCLPEMMSRNDTKECTFIVCI